MVSEYFVYKQKGEKFTEEKATKIIGQRISDLKDYIYKWITDQVKVSDSWIVAYAAYNRFYMNLNVYEKMKYQWTQETRIKIDDYDWRYLLLKVVHERFGGRNLYKVSYANGTMGICLDYPPCCMIYTNNASLERSMEFIGYK